MRANALFGLIVAALVFVPLERVFALRRGQKIFREGWRTDVLHFLFTRVLSDVCAVLTLGALFVFLRRLISPELHAAVAAQPQPLQFAEAVLIANLGAYFGHRLSHSVPLLWRFHAVHHSSERMDWLAAARVHPLDQVVSKGLILVPLYLLGFSRETFGAYLALATFHAVFVHANVRLSLGPLRWVIATPAYHHWHHSDDPRARQELRRGVAGHRLALRHALHARGRVARQLRGLRKGAARLSEADALPVQAGRQSPRGGGGVRPVEAPRLSRD